MGFKMKKMIFGKVTGSAREAAKTHAKTNHVTLSSGPKPYTGGVPGQAGYVSPDDPDQFRKLYSDQDYLSFTGDPDVMREEGQLLPGDFAKRFSTVKPAGPVMEAGEGHENYFGLKDESAGYDKFNDLNLFEVGICSCTIFRFSWRHRDAFSPHLNLHLRLLLLEYLVRFCFWSFI